jgi:hypothetical protein
MKPHTPHDPPQPAALVQRTQQLRTLWQSLPACVCAFAPRRPAAG